LQPNLKFLFTMRKLFALLLVAGTFAFAACEGKKEETSSETTIDSTTTVEETAPVDTIPAPVVTDSVAADTTKK
jgi:hypothetical protein